MSLLRFLWRTLALLTHGLARSLGLAFLLLLGTAVAGVLVLRHMFDEERLKAIVASQLQEVFLRPVQIDELVLTPQGATLRGLRVLERPGAGVTHLLSSDTALMTVNPLPLLKRRLEFSRIKLVSPRIHAVRLSTAGWNFSDLFQSTRTVRADKGPFALPVSLAADRTIIEQGMLVVDDRLLERTFSIERFNLNLSEFDVARPFAYAISFDNANSFDGRRVESSWSLEGSASLAAFDWKEAYLSIERGSVKVDGKVIRGSGRAKGVPDSSVELDLAVPEAGPETWLKHFGAPLDLALPKSRVRLKARITEATRVLVDELDLKMPPLALSVSGMVDWSSAPKVAADIVLGEFPLAEAGAFRASFQPYRLGGSLAASASLSGWWGRLQMHKGAVRLKDAAGAWKNLSVRGLDASAEAADDFSRVQARVGNGTVRAFGNEFTSVRLSAALAGTSLSVGDLRFGWSGSSVRLKAKVRNVADPKDVAVVGALDRLRWEDAQKFVEGLAAALSDPSQARSAKKKPWVKTFKYAIPKKFPDTVGRISVGEVTHQNFTCSNLSLLWDIKGVSPTLRHVDGNIRAGFGPGRVADIPAVQSSHEFLKVIFLPFVFMHKMNNLAVLSAATAYPKTLDFNRIEGEYGLEGGLATMRYFYVDSPQLAAYADGTTDFAKEQVDMNILTRLTHYRSALPEWWVDEAGRPAIAFRVKGDLNDPSLDPRLRKMKADEIETAKQEGVARAASVKSWRELDDMKIE